MIKKLFLWSVLLMTGFAFYSCDDVIDNPATEKLDPSNPNATWTYEVSVKFDYGQTYWENNTLYKFEAPQTLYVYNQKHELLGAITCNDSIDQDNYTADYYKFAGTLKGAIGDTLIIATVEDTWYAEKQDGTITNILKNGVLELGKAPIIVASTSTGKIGTQNVKLKNSTFIVGMHMYQYATGKEKYVSISSEDLRIPGNTMIVTFAEEVDLNDKFWVAYPVAETINSDYFFKTTDEDGVDLFGEWLNMDLYPASMGWTWWVEMWPKAIDLKKHVELFGSWVNIYVDDLTITQSGDEAIDCDLRINSKGVTLKGININGSFNVGIPYNSSENSVTIEGENTISSNNWTVWSISNPITLKGTGTLSLIGTSSYGIYIQSWNNYYVDDETYIAKPGALTIEEGVTVKAKAYSQGVRINSLQGQSYSYMENGEWKDATADENFENTLIINGNLEVESDYVGIYKRGIITIGETGSVKVTSNNANWKIRDANITEGVDYEAALETLVADKSKFNDEMSTDKKVRTITKK